MVTYLCYHSYMSVLPWLYLYVLPWLQEMQSLPDYIVFKYCPGTPLKDIFTAVSEDMLQILESMLQLNPLKRCNATKVSV